MIPIRLIDIEDDPFGHWGGGGEIRSARFEFAQPLSVIPLSWGGRPARGAIDHVEFVVRLEPRMQGEAEKSTLFHAFAQFNDLFAQIQKWTVRFPSVAIKDLNDTGLLGEQQPAGAVWNRDKSLGSAEPVHQQF